MLPRNLIKLVVVVAGVDTAVGCSVCSIYIHAVCSDRSSYTDEE